jgi:hypothetical protein
MLWVHDEMYRGPYGILSVLKESPITAFNAAKTRADFSKNCIDITLFGTIDDCGADCWSSSSF